MDTSPKPRQGHDRELQQLVSSPPPMALFRSHTKIENQPSGQKYTWLTSRSHFTGKFLVQCLRKLLSQDFLSPIHWRRSEGWNKVFLYEDQILTNIYKLNHISIHKQIQRLIRYNLPLPEVLMLKSWSSSIPPTLIQPLNHYQNKQCKEILENLFWSINTNFWGKPTSWCLDLGHLLGHHHRVAPGDLLSAESLQPFILKRN